MNQVLYDLPGPRTRRRTVIGSVLGGAVIAAILAAIVWKLAVEGQFAAAKWAPFLDPGILRGLLRALGSTIRAAVFSVILALVFGGLMCAGRLSQRLWLRAPSTVVIEFFRAVPLLLLILFLFLGFADTFEELGDRVEDAVPDIAAAVLGLEQFAALGPLVLALMLYNGSVLAEIFRAGISSIPRGQSEAAYAIGLRKTQVLWTILIPQAVRVMLPAIVSQCVIALKDTALGFVIGYLELVRQGRLIYDANFNIIPTGIVLAVVYIALNMTISRLATWLEHRQSRRYGTGMVQRVEAAVDVH